jgi:hypothetical protein
MLMLTLVHTKQSPHTVLSFYLNQNKDVIDSDGENKEGNDLEDNKRCRNSGESENSDRGRHRQQHNHYTAEA